MIQSRFFKIIWGMNGIGILILVIAGLIALGKDLTRSWFREPPLPQGIITGKKKLIADSLRIDLQHLVYDRPSPVPNSDYYYTEVYAVDKKLPPEIKALLMSANDFHTQMIGAMVNILFFSKDQSDVHPLLNTFGYISEIIDPNDFRYHQKKDTPPRDYFLYRIALRDTNGDMRINDQDSSAYFMSDSRGRNLKRITPFATYLECYSISNDLGKIYFEEVEPLNEKDIAGYRLKIRRMYVYNVKQDTLIAFDKLQQAFNELQEKYRHFLQQQESSTATP